MLEDGLLFLLFDGRIFPFPLWWQNSSWSRWDCTCACIILWRSFWFPSRRACRSIRRWLGPLRFCWLLSKCTPPGPVGVRPPPSKCNYRPFLPWCAWHPFWAAVCWKTIGHQVWARRERCKSKPLCIRPSRRLWEERRSPMERLWKEIGIQRGIPKILHFQRRKICHNHLKFQTLGNHLRLSLQKVMRWKMSRNVHLGLSNF